MDKSSSTATPLPKQDQSATQEPRAPPISSTVTSSLIFPLASTTLKTTLTSLRRHHLTLTNRLHSIKRDADFVSRVAKTHAPFPLIANERCGSWYVPPENKGGSAYFKSTDGHFGEWGFSLRRLNVQVLGVVGEYGGCIIVDSTRKGKSMPDAMSKTVPIWIAVLNRLLFPERIDMHALRTPADVVSRSEHAQIEERLSECVNQVKTLQLDLDGLRGMLRRRPMRPVWVTPAGASFPERHEDDEGYHSVVLCTASGRDSGSDDPNYVQGAADDHEAWGLGLDALVFWNNINELLSASEDELPAKISELISNDRSGKTGRKPTLIKPTGHIWIADHTALEERYSEFDIAISCSPEPDCAVQEKLKHKYLHLTCPTGKFASRQLRTELPKLMSLRPLLYPEAEILVTCPTGRDLAVGTALALICLLCGNDGSLMGPEQQMTPVASKAEIKHRLSWIMVSMPDASPSRATLQSVNAFLMG